MSTMYKTCEYDFYKVMYIRKYVPSSVDRYYPDSNVLGANMGPTRVLSAPDGPHVGPMNIAIRVQFLTDSFTNRD